MTANFEAMLAAKIFPSTGALFTLCTCRDSNRSLDIFDEKKHPLSVSSCLRLREDVVVFFVCLFVCLVSFVFVFSFCFPRSLPSLAAQVVLNYPSPENAQREKVPDDYSVVDPEHKLIYRFIRTLFSSAQLTAECAIVTLVTTHIAHFPTVDHKNQLF